nr:glycosyltransferase [Acinetobacter baumannii]
MLVSVVLPAYNAELYLKEAIDSVLSQTFTDFEL